MASTTDECMEKRDRRIQEDGLMTRTFTVEEVKRLRDLNIELLEAVTLIAASLLKHAREHDIYFSDKDGLVNLLGQASKIIKEINEEATPSSNLQRRIRLSDYYLQHHRTDEEVTEPYFLRFFEFMKILNYP